MKGFSPSTQDGHIWPAASDASSVVKASVVSETELLSINAADAVSESLVSEIISVSFVLVCPMAQELKSIANIAAE